MGDVSQLMPAIHPYVGGATGLGHGNNYVVRDYGLAVVTAAKALADTVVDLLADGAEGAGKVLANHQPAMTKDEYLQLMRGLAKEELYTVPDGDVQEPSGSIGEIGGLPMRAFTFRGLKDWLE